MNFDSLAVLQALPDALLVCDADGVVQFVNPAAERLLRVRAEELVGGHELPYISPEQLTGESQRFDVWFGLRSFEVELVQINPNQFAGTIVFYRGVTWQQKSEKYNSYLSFDINLSLQGVKSLIEMVSSDKFILDVDQAMALQIAQKRLEGIINITNLLSDWMTYDSYQDKHYLWQARRIDVNDLLSEVFDFWSSVYEASHINVELQHTNRIVANHNQIKFVFNAIFNHILVYMNNESSYTISTYSLDGEILIVVEQSKTSDGLFFNFDQFDTCQRIIEAHGGTFIYEKHSDTASTFTITLPIAEPEQ